MLNTYRIHYTRRDPVYGPKQVVLYFKSMSAKRTVKANTAELAVQKLIKAATKDRPNSTVEIAIVRQIEGE